MSYVSNLVKKPWGYEYLAYENDECALWFLYIQKGHKTSMHCHPNKTTGLVLLDGSATVSFLSDSFDLSPLHKIMIRKGLFHSTCATNKPACVFEVETPVDKLDLVRLRDNYGREGQPYENSTFEIPKESDCLWIENPNDRAENIYQIANTKLTVKKLENLDFFNLLEDSINVMFLQGGILTEYKTRVAGAGDIVSAKVIKELISVFNAVEKDSIIMVMEKNV